MAEGNKKIEANKKKLCSAVTDCKQLQAYKHSRVPYPAFMIVGQSPGNVPTKHKQRKKGEHI
jgi:hypothetical protein